MDVISISVKLEAMSMVELAKGEHIEDEDKGTKPPTPGSHLVTKGWWSVSEV